MNYVGKPSIYLPSCAVLWGVISMLSGQYIRLSARSI